MPNKRIDQLNIATDIELHNNSKVPVDVNGVMKSATIGQLKDKVLAATKTINGQSINGVGNLVVPSIAMSAAGESTVVSFATSKYYGTATNPVAGNITYDLAAATAGINAVIFHYANVEPVFPAGTYKLDSSIYAPNSLNIITLKFIDTDSVLIQIHRTANVGLTPEVQTWLDKGGVATGFLLNALNQFMLDIALIRSKILRFNPLWGETFASCFIPLIVNDNGSNIPLGLALDANYSILSSQWKNIGSGGAFSLSVNSINYLDTGFIPNNQPLYGLNNCSFGFFGNIIPTGWNDRLDFGTGNGGETNGSQISNGEGKFSINGGVAAIATTIVVRPVTINRLNSSEFVLFRNGTSQVISSSSVGKSTGSFKLGNIISGNGGKVLMGGYFIGKGLTDLEVSVFNSAWITLITKTGRI